MLGQGKELAAIDFSAIIGGPLEAVITAQARAAQLTTDFIQNTAFEQSGPGGASGGAQKLKVVTFDYGQLMQGSNGSLGDGLTIKVPLLTMLPIPFIRVDSMTIDFNVTLHSVINQSDQNQLTVNNQESGGQSTEFEHFSFQTSVTEQNTFQESTVVDDTYSLKVTVHAVQDQMPGGMQNVLNIFSNVIQQQSSLIQQVMTASIQAQSKSLQQAMGGNTTPTKQ